MALTKSVRKYLLIPSCPVFVGIQTVLLQQWKYNCCYRLKSWCWLTLVIVLGRDLISFRDLPEFVFTFVDLYSLVVSKCGCVLAWVHTSQISVFDLWGFICAISPCQGTVQRSLACREPRRLHSDTAGIWCNHGRHPAIVFLPQSQIMWCLIMCVSLLKLIQQKQTK